MPQALLIGDMPDISLGFSYVNAIPYDAVVIGSLRIHQLLQYNFPDALRALLLGIPVYVWLPGLEHRQLGPIYCSALYGKCLSRERELSDWGMQLLRDVPKPPLITALGAQGCLARGTLPPSDARLTPLARDILGGTQ